MASKPASEHGRQSTQNQNSHPWYPLAFSRDLVREPQRITVHGIGYALFRSGGAWQAVLDRCPHRAARLSDGVVQDGRLECLYHGWQFGVGGQCQHIPQLLDGQKMPAKAHVASFPVREEQGILWLNVNPLNVNPQSDPEMPGEAPPPILEALEKGDGFSIDFMIDLPYEQSFLIENVIDIAHIHVAHHGVRGGGHRDMSAPLDFEVSERTEEGFTASFRSVGLETDGSLRGARVRFVAPNLVHYESLYEDPELFSGLALYSLPLGPDRCRLLYRAYSNFPRLRDRLRPRWLEHFTQCTILEQDMDVVQGQVEEIVGSGKPPRDLWLPLKSSDALVIAYRRWLDDYAPWARVGFSQLDVPSQPDSPRVEPVAFDRLSMHTTICSSCSKVHQRLLAVRTPLAALAFALLAAAAATGDHVSYVAATLAIAAGAGRLMVDRIERRFRGRG